MWMARYEGLAAERFIACGRRVDELLSENGR
jgi:hypothetical protein